MGNIESSSTPSNWMVDLINRNVGDNARAFSIPQRNESLDIMYKKGSFCCSLCEEFSAVHAMLPCGHRCICNRCLDRFIEEKRYQCLQCLKEINSII